MKGIISITVTTDAGFCPIENIGVYAYWIRGKDLLLKGSGVFKEKCASANDAETKSIINALHIVKKANLAGLRFIYFNRDNKGATADRTAVGVKSKLFEMLDEYAKECGVNTKKFYTFRHVKGHSGTDTARKYVHDWADKECRKELKKARTLTKEEISIATLKMQMENTTKKMAARDLHNRKKKKTVAK